MISKLKIYRANGTNPYTNLAIEKVLFDSVEKRELILYLWQNKNTVVIGQNQNPWKECLCEELKKDSGFLARRLSGGGAVFHDLGNLNFTFICHSENYDLNRNLNIIKTACEYANIDAEISGRNDILASGKKFSGNAFYNSLGKSYHHGTILVSADKEKMQKYLTPSREKLASKGVKSVKSRTVNLCELNPEITIEKMAEFLIQSAEKVCGLTAEAVSINDENKVNSLAKIYGSWEYLYGKTIPFSCEVSARFDWGNFDLLLMVEKGKIRSVQFFTDSLDWELSSKVNNYLVGCPFAANDIFNCLNSVIDTQTAKDITFAIEQQLL